MNPIPATRKPRPKASQNVLIVSKKHKKAICSFGIIDPKLHSPSPASLKSCLDMFLDSLVFGFLLDLKVAYASAIQHNATRFSLCNSHCTDAASSVQHSMFLGSLAIVWCSTISLGRSWLYRCTMVEAIVTVLSESLPCTGRSQVGMCRRIHL